MPTKVRDETGNVYGRLRVISLQGQNTHKQTTWLCACECGEQVVVVGAHMRRGKTKSCGCLRVDLATYASKRRKKSKLRYFKDDYDHTYDYELSQTIEVNHEQD